MVEFPASEALPHRARQILYASITEFIATGEPVGSRTLAKKYALELSPASIRNVLSDLEEAGYLRQPHTSAGRVPTEKAYRFFIDTLMQVSSLSGEDQSAIERRFTTLGEGSELLRGSGRILSELTGTAAVVVSPRPESLTLKTLRFIPTRPGELLAVLVLSDGSVENRFVRTGDDLSEVDIARVHELLADIIDGRTLSEVRELCARRLADERVQVSALRRQAFDLGHQATDVVARTELVIEGHARLLEHPELKNIDRLKALMLALEDRELLVTLLDKTITSEHTNVILGSEAGNLGDASLSVVAAPYADRGRVVGAIGVLGVMRMDYPKVVPVVTATAKAMSAALDRAHGRDGRKG